MHTKKQKKHTPPKAAAIRLTLLLFSMCTMTTRPLPKFRAAKQTQQIATREQIELHPCTSKRFLLPNITYILIIHSGPVARTVPIKNRGQDSSTSQLE